MVVSLIFLIKLSESIIYPLSIFSSTIFRVAADELIGKIEWPLKKTKMGRQASLCDNTLSITESTFNK